MSPGTWRLCKCCWRLNLFLETSTGKASRGAAECSWRCHRLLVLLRLLVIPKFIISSFIDHSSQSNIIMKPSTRLLQHACRITFFTRQNCMLCTNAKGILSDVWDKRPFEYKEIDVMTSEGKYWRDFYEFDTPVVGQYCSQGKCEVLTGIIRFISVNQHLLRNQQHSLAKLRNSCIVSRSSRLKRRWIWLKGRRVRD